MITLTPAQHAELLEKARTHDAFLEALRKLGKTQQAVLAERDYYARRGEAELTRARLQGWLDCFRELCTEIAR